MHIGICTIDLQLPGNSSLKGKRRVLKSIVSRVGREFNVSIAEVADQDAWQRAVLGVSVVSNSAAHAHRQLEKVVDWIEFNRPDTVLLGYDIEML